MIHQTMAQPKKNTKKRKEPQRGADAAKRITSKEAKQLAAEEAKRVPRRMRALVFERDAYVCVYCLKATGKMTADHVLATSRGGKTVVENIACACKECNEQKAGWPVHLFAELLVFDGKAENSAAVLARVYAHLARKVRG